MARHAQRHQIALVIRAAIGERLSMMYQRCQCSFSRAKTHLAERMRRDVAVADFSPRAAVPLMLIVATSKMLVVPLHQASMLFAISAPMVGQLRTTSVAAGAFRFRWHWVHLGNKKPPQGLLPLEVLCVLHFCRVYHIIVKPMNGR